MIVKRGLGINVVEAARRRIIDAFATGRPIRLSFSGGKDSLVLGHIIYELIVAGKINPSQLTVMFIDEEAMFDEVISIVKHWRMKFMEVGAKFEWYCMQVKHFDCLNSMTSEETFICWDSRKKDVWVREMPSFAIKDDEFLIPRQDNYQSFLDRKQSAYKWISMRGVRVAESVQRYQYIALKKNDDICLPIYDMSDKDVWLYIKKFNIEYPKVYENLYSVGTSKGNLRISQFFSIDTARVLVKLGEMYPDLMNRVQRREPNAYLCALYWDTEMFSRNTKKRKELEANEKKKDYKKLCAELFDNPELCRYPKLVRQFKRAMLVCAEPITEKDYQKMYEICINGDPKGRSVRAFQFEMSGRGKKI